MLRLFEPLIWKGGLDLLLLSFLSHIPAVYSAKQKCLTRAQEGTEGGKMREDLRHLNLGRVPLLARHAGGARRDFYLKRVTLFYEQTAAEIPAKWRLHSLWMSASYPLLPARHLARTTPARHNKWGEKSQMNGLQRPEDVWFIFLTLLK